MNCGLCGLCYYARPLYDPMTKEPIKQQDGRLMMVCVFDLDNILPVVQTDTDAMEQMGWACFTPMPK